MTTTKKSASADPTLPEGAVKEPETAPPDTTPIVPDGATAVPSPALRPVDYQYDDPATYPVVAVPPASDVGNLGQ